MSNEINHPQKSLNECNPGVQGNPNLDFPPPYCGEHDAPNLRDPNDQNLDWLKDVTNNKTGFGAKADCDPFITGKIVNDDNVDKTTLYRYAKSVRGTDEAMLDLFSGIIVIDEDGKRHPVPVVWASQEKAVAMVVFDNVRQEDNLVVDRIRLPMLAISSTDIQYDSNRYTYHKALDFMRYLRKDNKPGFAFQEKYERDTIFGVARGIPVNVTYTLYAWTMYIEDMNQILEQILLKFSPVAYIRVRGVTWEIQCKLDSIANNLDTEPGDQAIRVIKFQFNITAETYISQPIARRKAVLKTNVELVNGMTEDEITSVLASVEEVVKELEC